MLCGFALLSVNLTEKFTLYGFVHLSSTSLKNAMEHFVSCGDLLLKLKLNGFASKVAIINDM